MNRYTLLVVILTLGLVVPSSTSAQATSTSPDLAGSYRCEGVNPDGTPYTGRVDVTAEGQTWLLSWALDGGGTGVGIGLFQAQVLAVIFKTNDGSLGLASYVLEHAATTPLRLVGRWTVPGAEGRVFTETLTKTTERVAVPPPAPPKPLGRPL